MNAVMAHNLDRSGESETHSQTLCSDKLRQCVSALSLVDPWRLLNPSAREYTFFFPPDTNLILGLIIFLCPVLSPPHYAIQKFGPCLSLIIAVIS